MTRLSFFAVLILQLACDGSQAVQPEQPPSSGGEQSEVPSSSAERPPPNRDGGAPTPDQANGGAMPEGSDGVASGYSREAIRNVIRQNRNQVRYCYERELANEPQLAGRVLLTFIIGADGAVRSTNPESDPGLESVGACAAERARGWTFPAPDDGVVQVSYPFVFGTDDALSGETAEPGAPAEAR
ncbi:MAG: AgmX/PglI C-terminal domain-containing protein [Myxococcota bacterium]